MTDAARAGAAGETRWSVLSRGDRVRGRLWKPPRRGPHAVAILCSADGCSGGPLVERARAAWTSRAALATFDLPLCGARRSDKLSASALDPSHPHSARLRADLEAQTAADLEQVVALLRRDPDLDPARMSLIGVGLGARLASGFAAAAHGLASVLLAPEQSEPSDDWLRSLAARIAPS
ncbi:MAG: hypothetical protein ACHQ6T_00905 [Myxococcota bacterium]